MDARLPGRVGPHQNHLTHRLSAVAVLFNYWIPDSQISNAVWITIAYVVVIVLNCFPAVVYGEVEFIFSSIKVITIIGLISEQVTRES